MRRVDRRQPIHLNSCNRGRLRKVQHHCVEPSREETALLLTPNHLVVNISTSKEPKQKPLFYLRKQQLKGRNSEIYAQNTTDNEDGSETFRAIHTASPYHSLRKVPLRSVTPFKPHRKDYFSNQKSRKYSAEAEAGMLREEILSMKLREMKNAQLGKTAEAVTATQQFFPRYAEYAGSQEFYQYRSRKSPILVARQQQEERHRVAGTRIEPFKKYQIREVRKSGCSQRNYEYPLMIGQ